MNEERTHRHIRILAYLYLTIVKIKSDKLAIVFLVILVADIVVIHFF